MPDPDLPDAGPAADLPPIIHTVPTPEGVAELMERSLDWASEHARPAVTALTAPDDDTVALATVGRDGLELLDPSDFDPWRKNPLRRTGTATMTSLDSLVAHVRRFRTDESALFANDNRQAPSLTAVLDYHERVNAAEFEEVPSSVPLAQHGEHRTIFRFPLSDEWTTWTAASGKALSMKAFAAFLEDHIIDVLDAPTGGGDLPEHLAKIVSAIGDARFAGPSALYQLATGLKVHEKSEVAEAVNLASGEGELKFKAEHVDAQGAKLTVPNFFLIGIPVFRHGEPWRIGARLRYRKTDGGLVFWFDLLRADLTFDTAFKEACESAAARTDLPLFFGAPETAA